MEFFKRKKLQKYAMKKMREQKWKQKRLVTKMKRKLRKKEIDTIEKSKKEEKIKVVEKGHQLLLVQNYFQIYHKNISNKKFCE